VPFSAERDIPQCRRSLTSRPVMPASGSSGARRSTIRLFQDSRCAMMRGCNSQTGVTQPDPACLQHMQRGVRTRDRVVGAGYACNARPDLHTICRSFSKISSDLGAKVCGGSKSARRPWNPRNNEDTSFVSVPSLFRPCTHKSGSREGLISRRVSAVAHFTRLRAPGIIAEWTPLCIRPL
jgi:hypothetical protein